MTSTSRPRSGSGRAAVRLLPRSRPHGSAAVEPVRGSGSRADEHTGQGLDRALVDCALYVHGTRRGGQLRVADALAQARAEPGGFVWIGLHEPDAASLQGVAEELGLHALAVEDAVHAHQRPKLETFGDGQLFVVLKTVRYVDVDEIGRAHV